MISSIQKLGVFDFPEKCRSSVLLELLQNIEPHTRQLNSPVLVAFKAKVPKEVVSKFRVAIRA